MIYLEKKCAYVKIRYTYHKININILNGQEETEFLSVSYQLMHEWQRPFFNSGIWKMTFQITLSEKKNGAKGTE